MYNGLLEWRMYCVLWKTRNARPARKSRDDRSPATGRSVKPVQSISHWKLVLGFEFACLKNCQPLRKLETSSSCGMLSALYPQLLISNGNT